MAIIDVYLDWCQKHRAPDTYEWYRYRLERFARKYPSLSLAELRPFHVQEWLDEMPLASGSKRNYCRAIKRCLRWAKKQGYIDSNPIADMDQPSAGKRDVVLSQSEFDELIQHASTPEFRDLLHATWETGCRPQESLRVEARHVELTTNRWVFGESEGKGGVGRAVYLTEKATAITRRPQVLSIFYALPLVSQQSIAI